MNSDNPSEARVSARVDIGGDQRGQIAVGNRIEQQMIRGAPPTDEEIAELREQFHDLRRRAIEEAPPEMRDEAQAKVAELEAAVIAAEPDLTTMEYLRNWFVKRLPSIAGAVTGVIVNPIVGALVGAAGDSLAAEFRRRFGAG